MPLNPGDYLDPIDRPAFDPKNPAMLCHKLEMLAGGMDQQSEASQHNSAMAGHPAPAALYADAAETMRQAVKFIQSHTTPAGPGQSVPSAGVAPPTPPKKEKVPTG